MKAIETNYRGVRFRSRLEARWAVFFDAYGVRWEYEPQGFTLTPRLDRADETTISYLPDFWLPDIGVWAEVKGSLNVDEARRLLECAAALSGNRCTLGHRDMLVLGPFSVDRRSNFPVRLHLHKGDLLARAWPVEIGCWSNILRDAGCIGSDTKGPFATPNGDLHPGEVIDLLLRGVPVSRQNVPFWAAWETAVDKGLSARFEHGERG